MESSFNQPKEDVQQSKQIHERTITEITNDGCIIEKKIVEYPTEETIEIEEIEEVDGKIMSVKRSIVGEKKEEPSRPKTLAKLDNEPVFLVPGYRSVEMDEKTNSTTVTEKTTTGYKQTVTIRREDGTKKIQTKTYFDPVEIPGEEEEEESYEEIETYEPGSKQTTVKSIESVDNVTSKCTELEEQVTSNIVKQSDNTSVVNKDIEPISDQSIVAKEENQLTLSSGLKDIVIVPGHQKVEFDEKTNTTTVTEKTTTGYQQTIITVTEDGNTAHTKVFYDPLPGEETCEGVRTGKLTTKKIQTKSSSTNSYVVESVISGKRGEKAEKDMVRQQVEEEHIQPLQKQEHKIAKKSVHRVESSSTKSTYVNDLQIVPPEPTSLTQKKTTSDGKEIEVEITVSDGGKTKTIRKVVRQPSEEIEIEEYEETQTYEPGEVKVITRTKLIPFAEEIDEARKDMANTVVTTAQNSQTIAQGEQQENTSQIDVHSKTASKTTTMQHRTEVKYQVNVCAKVSETKTETKQSTTQANRTSTEAKETYTKTERIKANAYASVNILSSKTNEKDAKSTTQTLDGESTAVSKQLDSQITSENLTETFKKDSVLKSEVRT